MSKQFQVDDKVTVTRRGAIDWEVEDYTNEEWADLQNNTEYTVHAEYGDAIRLEENNSKYDIHLDHFTIVEKQQ
jgi:hypothetical protein